MSNSQSISTLTVSVDPVSPQLAVEEVGNYFLTPEFEPLLSIPVVDNGVPVGVVSRYQIMKIFLHRYGRELYGRRPISQFMNAKPLIVSAEQTMAEASQYITRNIRFPITEDFIIVQDGQYQGVGIVVDLLKAMEGQLLRRSRELANAYRELKASQAHLVQSEKMASLGQMVAGVAHEINTPLGYVRNNVELFQERQQEQTAMLMVCRQLLDLMNAPDTEESRLMELLEDMRELGELISDDLQEESEMLFSDTLYGIDQIADLVSGLKNFSRMDQAMADDVNINDCLDTTLKIAHNALKHKVTVIRRYGELPLLRCMPSKLNQVFLNLITNSAQAIETQGKLLLKTYIENEHLVVSIEDNGKGISKETLPRIFDPFFTTKPVGQGTGLGLAISYRIIQEHGGTIRVASRIGVGTRFLIQLPLPPSLSQPLAAAG